MGALIQTKGTQRLARLFNNRFDSGSIGQTRGVQNSLGISLKTAFSTTFDNSSLLTISDNFIAQFSTPLATWVPNGRDVLYPAATLVAVAVAGNTITFNDPAGAFPNLIVNNVGAADLDRPGGISKGAVVTNVARATPAANQTTVTFSVAVTAQIGDKISFCPPKHQNLVRRWRFFPKD